MSEEDAAADENLRHNQPSPEISFEDQEALETIATSAGDISTLLSELDEENEVTYWDSNWNTYVTAHDLADLDRRILEGPKIAAVRESGSDVMAHLPFSPEELREIAGRIDGREAAEWWKSASNEDIVLVDRWRRWLDHWFNDEQLDNPDNPAKQLIQALSRVAEVCDQHTPRSDS